MNSSPMIISLILTFMVVTPCMSNASDSCENDRCDSMSTSSNSALDEVAAMQLNLRTDRANEEHITDKAAKTTTKGESFELNMARIANAIYDWPIIGPEVDGWTIALTLKDKNGLFGTDKLSIYQKGDKCALAVSGSDDAVDWVQDFNFLPLTGCGVTLHSGFHNEASRLVNNTRWSEFKDYLTSSECGGGVYLVGHSLGGAIVSVIAGCMAHWPALQGIKLAGLYTFGAPGVSKQVLTNSGECFPGKRFYNHDVAGGDPVPYITSVIGLKHPKVEAVRLKWVHFFGFSKEVHACDDEDTPNLPNGLFVARIAKHILTPFYLDRVEAMY